MGPPTSYLLVFSSLPYQPVETSYEGRDYETLRQGRRWTLSTSTHYGRFRGECQLREKVNKNAKSRTFGNCSLPEQLPTFVTNAIDWLEFVDIIVLRNELLD